VGQAEDTTDALDGASDEVLLVLLDNLLKGLDAVARSLADGTFHLTGKKGEAPPSQSGQTTLGLLVAVNSALAERGYETIFREGQR
jgi:hypothetical protein